MKRLILFISTLMMLIFASLSIIANPVEQNEIKTYLPDYTVEHITAEVNAVDINVFNPDLLIVPTNEAINDYELLSKSCMSKNGKELFSGCLNKNDRDNYCLNLFISTGRHIKSKKTIYKTKFLNQPYR